MLILPLILLLWSRGRQYQKERENIRQIADNRKQENNDLQKEIALQNEVLRHQKDLATEREQRLEMFSRQMQSQLEILSSNTLEKRSAALAMENRKNIENILLPFHQSVVNLQNRIEEGFHRENREKMSLQQEIHQMMTLNKQLNRDAVELTEALRGNNKSQGIWGEMVLSSLLEKSGLREGIEFVTQQALPSPGMNGKLQIPDVIVKLPDERDIIIDSKVSLLSYETLQHSSHPSEKEEKAFLQSIKRHISDLAGKQYHKNTSIRSLDYVILFIPIEGAFSTLVQLDSDLLSKALQQGIVIVSPTTLMTVLRTIHFSWRSREQDKNALLIARKAGKLYDKLAAFVEDLQQVGTRINQSQKVWESAFSKLSNGKGNLLRRAEELKDWGAETSREIPELHSSE